MAFADEEEGGLVSEWNLRGNPAMRALLDHLAEVLAAEFLRLLRASVSGKSETDREEKK